ncbi:hypothetical protein BDP27DRAFT_1377301 [Rhodocollybia butyracea]|uniref:Uncharacterized protein n=1 Tax=Rhodocollybia butyracea TaxID=206335 RepID=A0A9P5TUK4_9AGAR|nr:hypothetical protein BDP27DRAFT_1377301 [Rhodocollybia butyracea]
MRFTAHYICVLLVASLSCVWAMPIARDRTAFRVSPVPLVARTGNDAKGDERFKVSPWMKKGPVGVNNFYWTRAPTEEVPSKILELAVKFVEKTLKKGGMPRPDTMPRPSKAPESFKADKTLEADKGLSTQDFPYAFEFDYSGLLEPVHFKAIMNGEGNGKVFRRQFRMHEP